MDIKLIYIRSVGLTVPIAYLLVIAFYELSLIFELSLGFFLLIILIVELVLERTLGEQNHSQFLSSNSYSSELYLKAFSVFMNVSCLFQLFFVCYFYQQFMQVQDSYSVQVTMIIFVGLVNGTIGFTVAHEQIHSRKKKDQFLSAFSLLLLCCPSYRIEHVRGHHRDVATPKDASSAPLGVSFYKFLPHAIFSNFLKAWIIALEDFRERKSRKISSLLYLLISYVVFLLFCVLALVYESYSLLFYFVGQGVIAISVMELTNYIQHYGLQRERNKRGNYERVTHLHAWDCNNRFSNAILLNLPRHVDHHLKPYKSCLELETSQIGRILPFGYLTALIVALIPPLWFYYMNRLIIDCDSK